MSAEKQILLRALTLREKPQGTLISLESLKSDTYNALQALAEAMQWDPVTLHIPVKDFLLFIQRLKACRDDEAIFPRGKWATVQRLQQLFDEQFFCYADYQN